MQGVTCAIQHAFGQSKDPYEIQRTRILPVLIQSGLDRGFVDDVFLSSVSIG